MTDTFPLPVPDENATPENNPEPVAPVEVEPLTAPDPNDVILWADMQKWAKSKGLL